MHVVVDVHRYREGLELSSRDEAEQNACLLERITPLNFNPKLHVSPQLYEVLGIIAGRSQQLHGDAEARPHPTAGIWRMVVGVQGFGFKGWGSGFRV